MADRYDVLVVGSGSAALGVARKVREAGRSVAAVDFRPFGGTCALRGCDPKKVLLAGAEAVDLARRMHGHGVAGETRIAWPELMAFERGFTGPVPQERQKDLEERGIAAIHGRARFTAPDRMEIEGRTVQASHIVLATGAEPVRLGIPGGEHVVTHEAFLSLERLPARIALVGGGYIAAEFSHIAAHAGARVTVLQRGPRMLAPFEPELVAMLMEGFRRAGIDVLTDTAVESIEKEGDAFRVRASTKGKPVVVEADLVVHAAGRKPDLASLRPEAGEVRVADGKLALNDYLQSESNPRVYAAGDAAQKGPPLTPVAAHDARVVAENLLHGNRRKPDYRAVPSVAFSLPPIAMVGLTEEQARKQGLRFRTSCERAPDWYTARRVAEPVYGFKVLVEEGTGRILGAHLVGPHADEVINVWTLAIRQEMTADELRGVRFAYPTGASDIGYML